MLRKLFYLLILAPMVALCIACGEDPSTNDPEDSNAEQETPNDDNDKPDNGGATDGVVRFYLSERSTDLQLQIKTEERDWERSEVIIGGRNYPISISEEGLPYIEIEADSEEVSEAVLVTTNSSAWYGTTPYEGVKLPYSQVRHLQSDQLCAMPMYASVDGESGNKLLFADGYAMVVLKLRGAAKIASVKVENLAEDAVAGISEYDVEKGGFAVTRGMNFAVLNCTNNGNFTPLNSSSTTTFCVMVAPGSYPQGLRVSVCDSQHLAKFYAIGATSLESGELYVIDDQYQPESDLVFYEGFDNFVWGGDVIKGSKSFGFAPTSESMGIASGTALTGYEDAFEVVAWNNPGSGFVQPNVWSEVNGKCVGEAHQMSDSYIRSRNLAEMVYMYRVQEHPGYVAIGTANEDRGIYATHASRGTKSIGEVKVTFRFAMQAGFTGDLLVQVMRGGVITAATLNGAEIALNEENLAYSKTIAKLILKNSQLPIPSTASSGQGWSTLELTVNGATDGSQFYLADNLNNDGVHGIYLDSIEARQVGEWRRREGALRVLVWNILAGMWCDQHNNYDNFVEWVKKYDPDVCIWCESETIYKDHPAKATMPEADRYLPNGWDQLAARYGHNYTAKSGDCGNYSQRITSKYEIQTLQTLVDTDVADKILTRGAGHFAIVVNGKKVNFVTLHLWPKAFSYGIPSSEEETSKANNGGDIYREFEMKYIVSKTVNNPTYAGEEYWVVAGDTNARSRVDNWHYGYSEADKRYLAHDVVRNTTNLKDVIGDRYPARHFLESYESGSRIDFIYTSPSLFGRIENSITPIDDWNDCHDWDNARGYVGPSDHRPVMVDFDMN